MIAIWHSKHLEFSHDHRNTRRRIISHPAGTDMNCRNSLIRLLTNSVCLFVIVGLCVVQVGCTKSIRDLNPFKSLAADQNFTDVGNAGSPEQLLIWHNSYESALKEARATGRPILANFTGSDWCHWCTKLKEDVLAQPEFQTWARTNAVLLELDYPKKTPQLPNIKRQNEELAQKYEISSYPTVLILDPTGNRIGKLGYLKNPTQWIELAVDQISNSSPESTTRYANQQSDLNADREAALRSAF